MGTRNLKGEGRSLPLRHSPLQFAPLASPLPPVSSPQVGSFWLTRQMALDGLYYYLYNEVAFIALDKARPHLHTLPQKENPRADTPKPALPEIQPRRPGPKAWPHSIVGVGARRAATSVLSTFGADATQRFPGCRFRSMVHDV